MSILDFSSMHRSKSTYDNRRFYHHFCWWISPHFDGSPQTTSIHQQIFSKTRRVLCAEAIVVICQIVIVGFLETIQASCVLCWPQRENAMITSDMSSSFQFQSSKNWDHQYPSLYLDAKKKQKTCEEECTTLDGLATYSVLMVIHSSTLSHIHW
jgi:hypothetical protein